MAYHAAGRLQRLGFAEELVPEAFYVVHAVCDDDVVSPQVPLHGGHFCGAGVLLRARGVVGIAGDAQRNVVDVVQLLFRVSWVGVDAALEVF